MLNMKLNMMLIVLMKFTDIIDTPELYITFQWIPCNLIKQTMSLKACKFVIL